MFAALGRGVVVHRRLVLILAAVAAIAGVVLGGPAFGKLVAGGFDDPHSESVTTASAILQRLGEQGPDVLVLYSDPNATVDSSNFAGAVRNVENKLRADRDVLNVASYYDTSDQRYVSAGRHATYMSVELRASDDVQRRVAYNAVKDQLQAVGLTTEVGGDVAIQAAVDDQTKKDVKRGEIIALPIVLILLFLIFRGVVAALMPLMLGVLAILGSLVATRAIESMTTVSTFAINSITLLGLGMGVDYALIMVSRYRDELRAGSDPRQAVVRTVSTAGRTVVVSGLTVTLSLASMLVFPEVFLKSMAYGGMAAVAIAMVSAVTVLPALLSVLGRRVDALSLRRKAHSTGEAGVWSRVALAVMRRPVLGIVAVVAILLGLASPLMHIAFGGVDQRILPTSSSARVAQDHLAQQFPHLADAPLQVLVEDSNPDFARSLSNKISTLPGATSAVVAATKNDSALLTVSYDGSPGGQAARHLVTEIRGLSIPQGAQLGVTGPPAEIQDQLDSLAARLPWMLAIMAAVTLVLLFLAFGSVLLPIKAVVVNALSVAASFGVLVWAFQDAHLQWLMPFTPTGYLEPTTLVLVLAVLFGLATDYEVFLLSRVREEWDATHDATGAVVRGLQRTGGLITAAALLLAVVTVGFATGQVVISEVIGVGMVVGLALDALLVRIVLVPAAMRMFGRASWWLPKPLRPLHGRLGIRETHSAAAAAGVGGAVR